MEKLYEKIDNLKEVLNETETIKKIKEATQNIMQDQELLKQIEDYNYTKDERVKEKILNNQKFREYKHQEAELNLLILEINAQLKQIIKKDKCGL
ncbi:MAG: YlbF family regulator [Bacilli bacterium]|nr:YlbF family regulator [Bacilli bacterium]